MPVTAQQTRFTYTGNGVTTTFAFGCRILAAAHMQVQVNGVVQASGYSVTGVNNPSGGNVVFAVAPANGAAIILRRVMPLERATDYQANGDLLEQTLDDDQDVQTMLLQQVDARVARSLRVPDSDSLALVDLPPAADRANLLLGFDGNGNPIATAPVAGSASALATQLASSSGSSGVGFLQSGTGAVARTVQDKLRDVVSALDFMTAAQIADVQARTLAVNVTAALQAAIDALPASGGTVLLPRGAYRIESKINIFSKAVYLVGDGVGGENGSGVVTVSATELHWYGGSTAMIELGQGAGSSVSSGGGIRSMGIYGRALASSCILVRDAISWDLRDLYLQAATASALLIQNTAGAGQPTGIATVENVSIRVRGTSTDSAHGIRLNGSFSSGAEGVTKIRGRNIRIQHANGDGLRIESFADNSLWDSLSCFRANSETGWGVNFASTNASSINGHHTFITPTLSGGMVKAQCNPVNDRGIVVLNLNAYDLAGAPNAILASSIINGAGKWDINGFDSTGRMYGLDALYGGTKRIVEDDSMRFIRWDSANNVLFTRNGSFLTGNSGGNNNVANAGSPRGGVDLTTGNVSGNTCFLQNIATLGASGVRRDDEPVLQIGLVPILVTTVTIRVGLMDAVSPNNGVFVQFDPAVNANWQFICRAGGTSTTVTTSLAGAVANVEFLTFLDSNRATLLYRALDGREWTRLAEITTNIPTAALDFLAWVQTNAAAGRTLRLTNYRMSFLTD